MFANGIRLIYQGRDMLALRSFQPQLNQRNLEICLEIVWSLLILENKKNIIMCKNDQRWFLRSKIDGNRLLFIIDISTNWLYLKTRCIPIKIKVRINHFFQVSCLGNTESVYLLSVYITIYWALECKRRVVLRGRFEFSFGHVEFR